MSMDENASHPAEFDQRPGCVSTLSHPKDIPFSSNSFMKSTSDERKESV
jgi:hypothetical protein